MSNSTDVFVIGGGPAGSTIANLAARRGHSVTLCEKDAHPRFHIGESLLPMNLKVFDELGVLDRVERLGITKRGADFTTANSGDEPLTYAFDRSLAGSPDHAFEVLRSEFDQALFEACREVGVDARDRTRVSSVARQDDGSHRVTTIDDDGTEQTWSARFVVDASGRDTFLSSSRGWKERNPRHASAAVYAHYRGVERRPGRDAGNVSIYWFEHGWVWLIPLRDDIMSVGAVCFPQHIKTRRGSLEAFLDSTLNGIAEVRERMRDATLATEVEATGNYSYRSSRMCGPGYLLVGDAHTFIDPVFSSGVYLAMVSAASGVDVADAWLKGGAVRYRLACWRHQRYMRRGLSTFSWFIYRFSSPAMRALFTRPQNRLRVVDGIVSMLAGDVFENPVVRRRLLLFKLIYRFAWLANWRDGLAARRRRRESIRQSLHGAT
ncbi:MAG: NAD(P)/FAD-dependent oxidoreductase [Pseudomonadota bacterium]